jgi:hypothetical protein
VISPSAVALVEHLAGGRHLPGDPNALEAAKAKPLHQVNHAIACSAMHRDYLVFGDIEGKLDVLRVECTKCSRRGVYYLHRLIERHGRKGNMKKWKEQLNGDCPKRDAHSPHERCDLVCPDLPKVL